MASHMPPTKGEPNCRHEGRANLPTPNGEPRNPKVAIGTIQRQEILSDRNSRTPTNIDAAASTEVSESGKHSQRPSKVAIGTIQRPEILSDRSLYSTACQPYYCGGASIESTVAIGTIQRPE